MAGVGLVYCGPTGVTQSLSFTFSIWEPPGVPHLCHADATSSCARGRTRECGCLAFGAAVAARSAVVCDHTNVTQTLTLAFQIWVLPSVPHLRRAAATSSCARVRTRECGCLARGADAATRNADVCDHTNVTQTLSLAFQIWQPTRLPHLGREATTSKRNKQK